MNSEDFVITFEMERYFQVKVGKLLTYKLQALKKGATCSLF